MPDTIDKPATTEGFHFVMYLTDDLARARGFYEGLFGWKPGAIESQFFVEYDLPDGNTFALGHLPNAPRDPSGNVMFGVQDVEDAVARVEALGGKLHARFGGEICTSAMCIDTEGNNFGLHQRK